MGKFSYLANLYQVPENYYPGYEKYLTQYRWREVKFLRVGLFGDNPLNIWKDYFGELAEIYGVSSLDKYRSDNVYIGDPFTLNTELAKKIMNIIVITSYDHAESDQALLELYWPILDQDGVLILEGVNTDLYLEKWTHDDLNHSYYMNGLFIFKKNTKRINSFDIFDTLVFRQTYSPISVLEEVSRRSKLRDFLTVRREAESRALAMVGNTLKDGYKPVSSGVWEIIYQIIQQYYSLSFAEKDRLAEQEILTELEFLNPIAQNISLVRDGDIIISDMYLPPQVLQRMLESMGLTAKVNLYVSPSGKSQRTIWPIIKSSHTIVKHLGDNVWSDVEGPKTLNISAQLTKTTHFTQSEQKWIDLGCDKLAVLQRYLRLTHNFSGDQAGMYMECVRINLPILFSFALHIHANIRDRTALFCTRDCFYLYYIYKQMFPSDNIELFLTSRAVYYGRTPEYERYVRSLGSNFLLVDLQGTGNSISYYFSRLSGIKVEALFYKVCYERSECVVPLSQFFKGDMSDYIEMLNYAPFGTLLDWKNGPITAKLEYDIQVIKPIISCIQDTIKYLSKYKAPDVVNIAGITDFRPEDREVLVQHYCSHDTQNTEYIRTGTNYRHLLDSAMTSFESLVAKKL